MSKANSLILPVVVTFALTTGAIAAPMQYELRKKDETISDLRTQLTRTNSVVVGLNQELEKMSVRIAGLEKENERLKKEAEEAKKNYEASQEEIRKMREAQRESIVSRGSKRTITAASVNTLSSRSSRPSGRRLKVSATAYTPNCPGCDRYTATGTRVKEGRTIAVKKGLIPLRKKVYVEVPDAPQYNGYYITEDVGGGVRGIDIFMESDAKAIKFGRKTAYVTVLD